MRRPMLAALLLSSALLARADDDELLADLLDVIAEETALATKTRLNSDFVPGLVTVLERERLLGLGMRTVWDALPLVPGVEASLDDRGVPTMTVRGVPFPFNSGSVQILLNNVPTGREAAGVNSSVLYLPISQIERIEFIRGPGSVIYGDFAFTGLLNIVTRQVESAAELGISNDSESHLQARVAGQEGDWRYSVDAAAQRDTDARLPTVSSGNERRHSLLGFFAHGDFSLQTNLVHRSLNERINPVGDYEEDSLASELRHTHRFSDSSELQSRINYLDIDIDKTIVRFDGSQAELGADWFWSGWEGHEWLLGTELQRAHIDEGLIDLRGSPLFPPIARPPVLDQYRGQHSFYAQDQWRLSPSLVLTYGLRYDDIDDIESRFTPRVSAVWQSSDVHLFKLQYAEGLRGTTFFELQGSTSVDSLVPEVNRTTELTYVFKQPQLTARATVFNSRISDMIFITFPELGFDNIAEARAHGLELEWSQQLNTSLRLDAQYSRTDSEDDRNPTRQLGEVTSTPDYLAHLALLYRSDGGDLLGLRWRAVGDRGGLDGYQELGLSYTRERFFSEAVQLRLGVDNLGNKRIAYPLPSPLGDVPFYFQHRTLWAELRWQPGG